VLGRRRGAGSEGGQGVSEDSPDDESTSARSVIDRLEEHQAWVADRFEELSERLGRIEAQLEDGSIEGPPQRGKGKEGMSRQEVLAVRATKKRARRAAELKAKHQASADEGEEPATT
jgi:hypothetical protein